MCQLGLVGGSLVAAVALVAGDAALAVADDGLDVEPRVLDVGQSQSAQDLVLLRVANVQHAVGRRHAQMVLVGHLGSAATRATVNFFHMEISICDYSDR